LGRGGRCALFSGPCDHKSAANGEAKPGAETAGVVHSSYRPIHVLQFSSTSTVLRNLLRCLLTIGCFWTSVISPSNPSPPPLLLSTLPLIVTRNHAMTRLPALLVLTKAYPPTPSYHALLSSPMNIFLPRSHHPAHKPDFIRLLEPIFIGH
jgi:hypothetical protein